MGYSYGTVMAIELVNILESLGYDGTLICIDGSPLFIKQIIMNLGIENDEDYEMAIICYILSYFIPLDEIAKHKVNIDVLKIEILVTLELNVSDSVVETFFV